MAPRVDLVLKRIAACILFVTVPHLPVTAARCSDIPAVYDIAFEFENKCSMTVSWEGPSESSCAVVGYRVQSAQGCPSSWTNSELIESNTQRFRIEDIEFITSCLLGNCYIRIIAVLHTDGNQSEVVNGKCYGVSDTLYESYTISLGK